MGREDVKKEGDFSPFGNNLTKRYVSSGGEKALFNKYDAGNTGSVELVDYMGGDETVERVATAGHGREIFPEQIDQKDFIYHLGYRNILPPFKSVQFKFVVQSPIEVALDFVYEPSVNVNEYSLRYSQALESSHITSFKELAEHMSLEEAERFYELIKKSREKSFTGYAELTGGEIDMARELARSGLGIDQDTRYFLKIDLVSLANFSKRMRVKTRSSLSLEYLNIIEKIASNVAPFSWNILRSRGFTGYYIKDLSMPRDNLIVDSSLSHTSWD